MWQVSLMTRASNREYLKRSHLSRPSLALLIFIKTMCASHSKRNPLVLSMIHITHGYCLSLMMPPTLLMLRWPQLPMGQRLAALRRGSTSSLFPSKGPLMKINEFTLKCGLLREENLYLAFSMKEGRRCTAFSQALSSSGQKTESGKERRQAVCGWSCKADSVCPQSVNCCGTEISAAA